KGRPDLNRFVALTATNHAKLYGLYPRKGTIAVGSDADIAIWDPQRQVTVRSADIHDNVGYTPYEGMRLTGWPVTVISRGRIVVDDGKLQAQRGSGAFLQCALSEAAKPLNRTTPELAFAARGGQPLAVLAKPPNMAVLLVWNTRGRPLYDEACYLCREHDVDIAIFAEVGFDPVTLLTVLNTGDGGTFVQVPATDNRMLFFTRYPLEWFEPRFDDG